MITLAIDHIVRDPDKRGGKSYIAGKGIIGTSMEAWQYQIEARKANRLLTDSVMVKKGEIYGSGCQKAPAKTR